jgi:leucyl-tRNA synthetase
MTFDLSKTEVRWQRAWDADKIFETDPTPEKPKFFITVAYPYPNSPQHVGHARTYTLTDVMARYKRMHGFNVLFPMAFHYTGTPILAMAKRITSGDKELEDIFLNIYHVPRKTLNKLSEPIAIANHFRDEIKHGMKKMGYSIDWRREFTTVDPPYSRFIEWQFQILREKGLVTQGSHPVGWCPSDGNPVGQHDTQGDVEPEIEEYVLVKFDLQGEILPTGTLRPETTFGVTNLWLRPDIEYVKAKVGEEIWVISRECVEKLRYLGRTAKEVGRVKGAELIGEKVVNPITGEKIPIFPAPFVDPDNATGVVMSVPGHAPYDYIALEDLKKNTEYIRRFGLSEEILESVQPISLIKLEGYSEFPAGDLIHRMGIESQTDPRVEDATKEVYSKEFHFGVMKENTQEFAGMRVLEAKDRVRDKLLSLSQADSMYEILNKPVFCRCGAECIVKLFENQWFINYGKEEWKGLARDCLGKMKIAPSILRSEFEYVVGWLREKACARKSGLGTQLPWAKDWIIESLSDSVIYMAYYTISKYIKKHRLGVENLNNSVFDYIFLGKGNPSEISSRVGLDEDLLRAMRNEFLYYYPLDSRNSGRDLIPNHLTFFIFNHAAIFPENLWPRQIVVNGSVLMEGKKMSKSLGNIIPLIDAVQEDGADSVRLSILSTAELLGDADFSKPLARSVRLRLEKLYNLSKQITTMKSGEEPPSPSRLDQWLLSRLQTRIEATTNAMDSLEVRDAIQEAFYGLDRDVHWYLRRTGNRNTGSTWSPGAAETLRTVLDVWIRLLSPFIPHLCEEIWSMLGNKGYVSITDWPSIDSSMVDRNSELCESLIESTLEDTQSILKAIKIRPGRICYYIAADWKWTVYLRILDAILAGETDVGNIIREFMSDPELRVRGEEAVSYIRKIFQEARRLNPDLMKVRAVSERIDELAALHSAADLFKNEFSAKVEVFNENDSQKYDPRSRSNSSVPYRPAIYVE